MKKEFMSVDIYDIPEILKVQTRTYVAREAFRSLWDNLPGVEAIEGPPTGDSLMLDKTGAHRRLLKAIKPYINETVALDCCGRNDGDDDIYKITDTLLVVPPDCRRITLPVPESIRTMAKWEWTGDSYRCNKCGGRVPGWAREVITGKWKYCPECGSPIEVKTYKMESIESTYYTTKNVLNKEQDEEQ